MLGKTNIVRLRHLQTSDVLHLASPIGLYYIYISDIHERYKRIFMHCIYWLYCVKARIVSCYKLSSDQTYNYKMYWQEIAAALEYLMPSNFFNCNEHILQHTVDEIMHTGPVYNTHMEPFEAAAKYLKGMITTSPSPEETITLQISFEWAAMLQRYEQYNDKQIQEISSPSIRRGTYPPIVHALDPITSYENDISTDDWKNIVKHCVENDPYLQQIQQAMQEQYPRTIKQKDKTMQQLNNNWTKMKLSEFVPTQKNFDIINLRLAQKQLKTITMDELNSIKQGPQINNLRICSKVKLNQSEFRSSDHQTNNTDYSGIKFVDSDNVYQYASIRRIYIIKPHIFAAEQTIFYVNAYTFINNNYTIELLQRVGDNTVAMSSKITSYVSARHCLDENIAFWPSTFSNSAHQRVCAVYLRSLDMYNYRQ